MIYGFHYSYTIACHIFHTPIHYGKLATVSSASTGLVDSFKYMSCWTLGLYYLLINCLNRSVITNGCSLWSQNLKTQVKYKPTKIASLIIYLESKGYLSKPQKRSAVVLFICLLYCGLYYKPKTRNFSDHSVILFNPKIKTTIGNELQQW